MSAALTLPWRRRWALLTVAGALGALAFVPALLASDPEASGAGVATFVAAVSVLGSLSAWFGLRWADAAGLPMPWLRRYEAGAKSAAAPAGATLWAAVGGLAFGLLSVAVLRSFGLPNLGGSLPARLATTLFAGVSLELVVHLAVMSGVVRLTHRPWAGVVASTLAFALFHGGGAFTQPAPVALCVLALNAAFGTFLGWLYARYGFEWVVGAHALAHAIAVGLALLSPGPAAPGDTRLARW
jgi:hypothetical protein